MTRVDIFLFKNSLELIRKILDSPVISNEQLKIIRFEIEAMLKKLNEHN